MFKKIVSNLPFSPSLIHQLGFYFNRLKKEETTRKIGLLFLVLAIIAQSLTIMQPAEPANASNNKSLINNAVPPKSTLLELSQSETVTGIIRSKKSLNISQGSIDATTIIAKAGDKISYTITIENTSSIIQDKIKIEDYLADVLEYAVLIDNGGGTLNRETKILAWPDISLIPGSKQTRTYSIMLLDIIPAIAQGISDKTSYDCVLTNTFGNSNNILIDCPNIKIVERIVTNLPVAGPRENIIFSAILILVITFLYARVRQQNKEMRLIKKDLSNNVI